MIWLEADFAEASQQGVEDDFSWDDEAESETASEAPATGTATATPTATSKTPDTPPPASDTTTPKPVSGDKMPSQPAVAAAPTAAGIKAGSTSTSTSPRDSEESYDLVSDQKKSAAQTEDDDSDWE